MARALRIEYPNAYYHVTCRGNEKAPIFLNDRDRNKILELLEESCENFQVEVHCYVLMSNHFHLLVKTPLANLSRFMQQFNTAYTVNFNKMHQRVGHLFQGRYKSIVVDADSYLKELSRYIHLNPIRIKKLKSSTIDEKIHLLNTYPWSSYLDYIGSRKRHSFLNPGFLLSLFGRTNREAYRNYSAFVLKGISGQIRNPFEEIKAGTVLGDDDFTRNIYIKYMDKKVGEREHSRLNEAIPPLEIDKIVKEVAEVFNVPPETLLKRRSGPVEARQVLIEYCLRYLIKYMTLQEIGLRLGGIGPSAFKMNRIRLQKKLLDNQLLKEQMEIIREGILSD